MGMFDQIKCEYPLPGNPPREVLDHAAKGTMQSKTFDCMMSNYIITRDGELHLQLFDAVGVPEEERYYYGKPEWEESELFRMYGSIRFIPTGTEKIDYHGDVVFYTIADDTHIFYQYTARFTEGKLLWIKQNGETE